MTACNPEPRLLTQRQAAAYCGVSATTFAKWVLAGALPPPLPAMRRWDKKAIDAHLDKASGIDLAVKEEDPLAAWRRERDAARCARPSMSPGVRLRKGE